MPRDLRSHNSRSSCSVGFRLGRGGTARFAPSQSIRLAKHPRSELTNLRPQAMMHACDLEPATIPWLCRNVLGFGQLKKRSMSSRPCLGSCSCLSSSAWYRGSGRRSCADETGKPRGPALYPLSSMLNSSRSPHPFFFSIRHSGNLRAAQAPCSSCARTAHLCHCCYFLPGEH